jgi:cytochrome c5
MKRLGFGLCSGLCLAAGGFFFLSLLAAAQSSTPAARHSVASSSTASSEIREGERLFQTHCGRCHNPPEDLSPREARAVVRQMRVRAMLSQRDEQALLKFLAP